MRLRPFEFTADPESPFEHDKLNRQEQVEALCRVLCGVEGHAVVSLDAPWGAGKSAFVKMCSAHLRSEEVQQDVQVVEFNAWRQNHTGNPLVDLVSAISDQIGSSKVEELKSTAGKLAKHLLRVGSRGVIELDLLEDDTPAIFASWTAIEEEIQSFAKRLAAVAAEAEGPLVVIVDELDRCRPSYALELLDTVRHLFAADGVMVILAINRAELIHSVESVYGPDFRADRYLRRFSDLHISLPAPADKDLADFLDGLLEATGLAVRFTASEGTYSGVMLQLVAKAPGSGLRDVEQAVHHTVVALASLAPPPDAYHSLYASEQLAVSLIVLKTLDEIAYRRIASGEDNGFEAIADLHKALGSPPEQSERANQFDTARERIETVLLAGIVGDMLESEDHKNEFCQRYMDAIQCGHEHAGYIFDKCYKLRDNLIFRWLELSQLTRLIDLVDYTPIETSEPDTEQGA